MGSNTAIQHMPADRPLPRGDRPRADRPLPGPERPYKGHRPSSEFDPGCVNVWPAPSARVLVNRLISLRQRIRSQGEPWPRWRSARPGPHKTLRVAVPYFTQQVSRTPIACQAISLPPPADFVSRSRWVSALGRSLELRRRCSLHVELLATPDHRPGDPRQLGGERHYHGVHMRPPEQATQPRAQWRLTFG